MATVRKRGSGWQAQIRKHGREPISKTFRLKADALTWSKTVESELERGIFVDRTIAERTTLNQVIDRYEREVLPTMRGADRELSRLRRLRVQFGCRALSTITSIDLATYRADRLRAVGPQSVRHELSLLMRLLKRAHQEWGIVLPSGVPAVSMPKLPQGRDRRLEGDEEERLIRALGRSPSMQGVVRFALATAMRRGEIVAMRWSHIDLKARVLNIPLTKTDRPRTIPLSTAAVAVLNALPRRIEGRIFNIKVSSISQAFDRACVRAGIEGLHFHDLRHEATSRLFEIGLSVMEVSLITGHADLRMLRRYTHLRPVDLLSKIG